MYRGFSLTNLDDSCFSAYLTDGRPGHDVRKAAVRNAIASFRRLDGSIDGSRLAADWFPELDCDVFISHAHKDSDLAIGLAGFLKYEFQLESFVDSGIWGCADDLLKMIDDEYCYQKERGTYSYSKRNRTTSHVHMMLSSALAKMINKCECIIFLNTPEAISADSYINESITESPWIYTELSMVSLIAKRSKDEHRSTSLEKSVARADESIRIHYGVDLGHLTSIGVKELDSWHQTKNLLPSANSLDILYSIVKDI